MEVWRCGEWQRLDSAYCLNHLPVICMWMKPPQQPKLTLCEKKSPCHTTNLGCGRWLIAEAWSRLPGGGLPYRHSGWGRGMKLCCGSGLAWLRTKWLAFPVNADGGPGVALCITGFSDDTTTAGQRETQRQLGCLHVKTRRLTFPSIFHGNIFRSSVSV